MMNNKSMSSNFGPLNRDHFSHNIHIKGVTVIDKFANISGNNVAADTLMVSGNAELGNIVSDNLIIANIITAVNFVGKVTGVVFDEMGVQILDEQQSAVIDPDVISDFIPGTNINETIVPQYTMPTLGSTIIPTSTNIKQDSVEHLLYYNHIQLRNEVISLRSQVVELLGALRNHGLINT